MGLTLNEGTSLTYCIKRDYYQHINLVTTTFLVVLLEMFDMGLFWHSSHLKKMYYISEFLSKGWSCTQTINLNCLHLFSMDFFDRDAFFRILQQFLALAARPLFS